jgi:hypothetical protein
MRSLDVLVSRRITRGDEHQCTNAQNAPEMKKHCNLADERLLMLDLDLLFKRAYPSPHCRLYTRLQTADLAHFKNAFWLIQMGLD